MSEASEAPVGNNESEKEHEVMKRRLKSMKEAADVNVAFKDMVYILDKMMSKQKVKDKALAEWQRERDALEKKLTDKVNKLRKRVRILEKENKPGPNRNTTRPSGQMTARSGNRAMTAGSVPPISARSHSESDDAGDGVHDLDLDLSARRGEFTNEPGAQCDAISEVSSCAEEEGQEPAALGAKPGEASEADMRRENSGSSDGSSDIEMPGALPAQDAERRSQESEANMDVTPQLLDIGDTYAATGCVWDGLVCLGTPAVGFTSSGMLLLLWIMNLGLVILFLFCVNKVFADEVGIDSEILDGLLKFRLSIAHSVDFADRVTGRSLASQVCDQEMKLHLAGHQQGMHDALLAFIEGGLLAKGLMVLVQFLWAAVIMKELESAFILFCALTMVPKNYEPTQFKLLDLRKDDIEGYQQKLHEIEAAGSVLHLASAIGTGTSSSLTGVGGKLGNIIKSPRGAPAKANIAAPASDGAEAAAAAAPAGEKPEFRASGSMASRGSKGSRGSRSALDAEVELLTMKTIRVVSMYMPRYIALVLLCCLPRVIVSGFLYVEGARWLASTISLADLILNSIALEFVLQFSSILYEIAAPRRVKTLVDNLEAMPIHSKKISGGGWETIKFVIKLAMMIGFCGCVMVWYIVPVFNQLDQAYKVMCSGDVNFVYATNPATGMVHVTRTMGEPPTFFTPTEYTVAQVAEVELFEAGGWGDLMDKEVFEASESKFTRAVVTPAGDWLAADMDHQAFNQIIQLSLSSREDAASLLPCQDLVSGQSPAASLHVLRELVQNPSVQSCKDVPQEKCSEFGLPELRAICPIHCGCDQPITGAVGFFGTPQFGCPSQCDYFKAATNEIEYRYSFTRIRSGVITACTDLDDGAVDSDGYNCRRGYYLASDVCGDYDDDDFTAEEMCCSCAGGVRGESDCDRSEGRTDLNEEGCQFYFGREPDCGIFDDTDFTASDVCCECGYGAGLFEGCNNLDHTKFAFHGGCANSDKDGTATDLFGRGCAKYDEFPNDCTLALDDTDFTGKFMCCACENGGSRNVPSSIQCWDAWTEDCWKLPPRPRAWILYLKGLFSYLLNQPGFNVTLRNVIEEDYAGLNKTEVTYTHPTSNCDNDKTKSKHWFDDVQAERLYNHIVSGDMGRALANGTWEIMPGVPHPRKEQLKEEYGSKDASPLLGCDFLSSFEVTSLLNIDLCSPGDKTSIKFFCPTRCGCRSTSPKSECPAACILVDCTFSTCGYTHPWYGGRDLILEAMDKGIELDIDGCCTDSDNGAKGEEQRVCLTPPTDENNNTSPRWCRGCYDDDDFSAADMCCFCRKQTGLGIDKFNPPCFDNLMIEPCPWKNWETLDEDCAQEPAKSQCCACGGGQPQPTLSMAILVRGVDYGALEQNTTVLEAVRNSMASLVEEKYAPVKQEWCVHQQFTLAVRLSPGSLVVRITLDTSIRLRDVYEDVSRRMEVLTGEPAFERRVVSDLQAIPGLEECCVAGELLAQRTFFYQGDATGTEDFENVTWCSGCDCTATLNSLRRSCEYMARYYGPHEAPCTEGDHDDSDFTHKDMCCFCSEEWPCVDMDKNNMLFDSRGAHCEIGYFDERFSHYCGNYDDNDFTASILCCTCNGGAPGGVWPPTPAAADTCDITDGSGVSSFYPCTCGNTTQCTKNQVCTAANEDTPCVLASCDPNDGSGHSTGYPCKCGRKTCTTYQKCTASGGTCTLDDPCRYCVSFETGGPDGCYYSEQYGACVNGGDSHYCGVQGTVFTEAVVACPAPPTPEPPTPRPPTPDARLPTPAPTPEPPLDVNETCGDTDDSGRATDSRSKSCRLGYSEWTTNNGGTSYCGTYDDTDFTANDMCCDCGGGADGTGCIDYGGDASDTAGYGCWGGYFGEPQYCGEYDDTDFSSNDLCCECGGGEIAR